MIPECFVFLPPEGKVVELFRKYRCVHFVQGFCREVIVAGGHMEFLGGFRLATDPGLNSGWAEPCELDVALIKGASFELVEEVDWMRTTVPPGAEFLPGDLE